MNDHPSLRHAAAVATACILLAGCASPNDDTPGSQNVRPSATLVPPASAESPASPTAGSANADQHGFIQ